MSEILYVVLPPTRIPYFLAMKEAAVPSAQRLLPYIMLFWGCKFKGEAHAARQRPAHAAKPTRPAAPRPRGKARTACTPRAYIGRRGMRTVKVVPLPGMLST